MAATNGDAEEKLTPSKIETLAEALPSMWLVFVVGVPMVLLLTKHGWDHSFQDGDMFLLSSTALVGVVFERLIELDLKHDLTDGSDNAGTLLIDVGLLAASVYYFYAASESGDGKADWVQVVVFFTAVVFALTTRWPEAANAAAEQKSSSQPHVA